MEGRVYNSLAELPEHGKDVYQAIVFGFSQMERYSDGLDLVKFMRGWGSRVKSLEPWLFEKRQGSMVRITEGKRIEPFTYQDFQQLTCVESGRVSLMNGNENLFPDDLKMFLRDLRTRRTLESVQLSIRHGRIDGPVFYHGLIFNLK